MSQDLPRIAKGFRTQVFLRVLGLFLIPFGAMLIGAYHSQVPPNVDLFQLLLKWVALVGGLIWLLALPYHFMVFTPKCDSCKIRTKRQAKLNKDGDEWIVTICPKCRERFRHRVFEGDSN